MSGVNHVRIMGLKTIKKIRAYLLLYSPIYLTAYAASAGRSKESCRGMKLSMRLARLLQEAWCIRKAILESHFLDQVEVWWWVYVDSFCHCTIMRNAVLITTCLT